jgi:hypothetical protein
MVSEYVFGVSMTAEEIATAPAWSFERIGMLRQSLLAALVLVLAWGMIYYYHGGIFIHAGGARASCYGIIAIPTVRR